MPRQATQPSPSPDNPPHGRVSFFIVALLAYLPLLFWFLPWLHGVGPQYGGLVALLIIGFFTLIAALLLFGILKSAGWVKNNRYAFFGAAAFWLVASGSLYAAYRNSAPAELVFSGMVYLDGKPAVNAKIALEYSNEIAQSNGNGLFSLSLPAGKARPPYQFRVSHPGAAQEQVFEVDDKADKSRLTFKLNSKQEISDENPPQSNGDAPAAPLEELEQRAKQGDLKAQKQLARMYDNGEGGVPLNLQTAYAYYLMAAQGSDAESQHEVALRLEQGRGVAPNPQAAFAWYEKAALQTHRASQWNLGRCYLKGIGVSQDKGLAYAWFDKVASSPVKSMQSLPGAAEVMQWLQDTPETQDLFQRFPEEMRRLARHSDNPASSKTSTASPPRTGSASRYIAYDNGTALDTKTGLMWMRCSLGQTWNGSTCAGKAKVFTWEDGKKQTVNFAGYSDWRLPTIEELRTLVYCSSGKPEYFRTGAGFPGCNGDYERPTIAQAVFPNTPESFVWSSSAYAYGSDSAWGVNFYYGYDLDYYRSNFSLHVRLVRGGQ